VRNTFALEDVIEGHPGLTRLVSFVLGCLTMLSFAPAGWYPLALFLVVPLLYAFQTATPAEAAKIGFAYGAGLFLTGTYWLYVSIHVFGQAPLVIAIFLMLALVFIMGLYYAAAGWLVARLSARHPWYPLIIAPATWVALEWLRGWFMSGFPWMTLGYSQIDSPLAGFAPVLGIFGVSLALMISAAALLAVLQMQGRQRLAAVVIALAPWIAGAMLKPIDWTEPAGPAITTTIVQGGVSQDRKWLREQFQPTVGLYREALYAHPDSDLVVWPEVAIPAVMQQAEQYIQLFEQDIRPMDTVLMLGILERDDEQRVYNSVVALDGERRQVYRKRHLVPFGEYFPVPDFIREWMRMMNLPYSDITSGDAEQVLLELPDGNRLSVAICYEDAYAAEQLYAFPDATLLINVSNDAWFGDSIAPHQHLEIARMRALEAGRYVVRATNNGVSAFIGPDGALLETGPQFEYVTLTREVIPRQGMTPYARLGNWPVILLCLAIAGGFGLRAYRQ
jgi:apolipoprotein N-acyltransferase